MNEPTEPNRFATADVVSTVTTSTVPERSADVVTRNIGGETILVPVRQRVGDLDHVFTLTPVATTIWGGMDGRRDVRELAALVCDEYDVEPQKAEEDLKSFVGELRAAGLIEIREKKA